jgi:hypothetical protein
VEPRDPLALKVLGRSLLQLQAFDAAAEALAAQLAISPAEAALGTRALVRQGQILAAGKVLCSGRPELEAQDPDLAARILQLLRHRTRPKAATAQERESGLELLMRLEPDDAASLLALMRLRIEQGSLSAVEDLWRKSAAGLVSARSDGLADVADQIVPELISAAKRALGEASYRDAHRWVSLALALDPENASASDVHASVKTRRIAEARKSFGDESAVSLLTNELATDYPDEPMRERVHAHALMQERSYMQARAVLAELCGHPAASADDFVQFARACRATHELDAAIDACFEALSRKHEHQTAIFLLTQLLPARE